MQIKPPGAKVASLTVDFCSFGPAQRMATIADRGKSDRGHPIWNKATILARREMRMVMDAVREHENGSRSSLEIPPRNDGVSCVFSQFKLNRKLGFALNHRNPFATASLFDQFGHGECDEIIASQLAVHRNVEQRKVTKITCNFKTRADSPHKLGNSGRFCPVVRPLFQALRFRVTAGSWTLGILSPPILPPCPDISPLLQRPGAGSFNTSL